MAVLILLKLPAADAALSSHKVAPTTVRKSSRVYAPLSNSATTSVVICMCCFWKFRYLSSSYLTILLFEYLLHGIMLKFGFSDENVFFLHLLVWWYWSFAYSISLVQSWSRWSHPIKIFKIWVFIFQFTGLKSSTAQIKHFSIFCNVI